MVEEAVWRKRLLIYSAVRFGALAVFFFGVAIMYTSVVRPGGWPQLGAVVAIAGVLVSLFAPRLLKKRWDAQRPPPQ